MSVLKRQLVEAARLLALKVHDLMQQYSRGAARDFGLTTPDGHVSIAVYGAHRNYVHGSTWVSWRRPDGRRVRKMVGQVHDGACLKDDEWVRQLNRVPLRVIEAAEKLARELEPQVPKEA